MKNLLLIGLIFLSITSFGQSNVKFKFPDTRIITDLNGGVIDRGDEFEVFVHANGNGDTQTRQLLFDIQWDILNFDLISVNHTGTVLSGGILPENSNPQLSWQNYSGYSYDGNTTDTNGSNRYQNNLNYTFNSNSGNSILRATLTWASTSGLPLSTYEKIIVIRFRLKQNSTANSFNPFKLNFVAAWNGKGNMIPTLMETPLSTEVIVNQNTNKFVTAKVDVNSNLLSQTNLSVIFRDTITNVNQSFNVLSNGNVDINQSLLNENTIYEVSVAHETDKLTNIYNNAITVSDFTTAQGEFVSMGLDASKGKLLNTGQSFFAADINRNKIIDGGDLPQLLSQVVGIDVLTTLPIGYTVGSGGFLNMPTWMSTDATTIAGQIELSKITVNHFGQGISRVLIDVREFTGTNISPENIKSLQLLDLYVGPVEFTGNDGTWVSYKVPSSFTNISSSKFTPYIRNINGSNNFEIKSEFSFNNSPSHSWGSITTTNWKDISHPKVIFKTGIIGSNTILDLKYLLWGDVNRSHSSQVISFSDGSLTLRTSAGNSLRTNSAFKTMSTESFINTQNNVPAINVNLSNITVTSKNVEIPISITTNGNLVNALQFEFHFDPSKIKFEEILPNLPNSWYLFINSVDGKIKFGAIDQNEKTPLNGTSIPFKIKFSTIGNGVDIITSVRVSPTMDASGVKGSQLGINLNTTQIKLTGYNNF
jgi:hypothetical protein